ncbi:MAG: alpha-L-fucosidase, partial [Bacteroides sp.]
MKKFSLILLALCSCAYTLAQQPSSIPTPKPHQLKWHEAEMGAVFHYDLHVFDGIRYGQGNNRINPIEDYNIFNPTELNTDQWVLAAKSAGCKFAVLTATHETGFGLWQSDVNPYCLKAVKWRDGKGDIVRDFVNSCRKYGVQPGIYIGIRWNSLLGIHNFKAEGEGEFARNRQLWYKRLCEKMVEEICTRYGDLFMIWFDGGADDPRGDGPDVEPIVNKYQPNCLFYHNIDRADFRWGGSETGTVGYPCWSTFPVPCSHHKKIESAKDQLELLKHGDKDGKYWVPAMADTPLRGANGRHEWFWEPDDENNLYPLDELMDKYEKSVGRNATLIMGLTPDPTGLLPAG